MIGLSWFTKFENSNIEMDESEERNEHDEIDSLRRVVRICKACKTKFDYVVNINKPTAPPVRLYCRRTICPGPKWQKKHNARAKKANLIRLAFGSDRTKPVRRIRIRRHTPAEIPA